LFLITGKHWKIWKKDKLNNEMIWNLNRVLVYIYLPKTSKYLYISLNISIFLPRTSNSLYISATIHCSRAHNPVCGGITL
jgi:hypothetical protein